MTLNTYILRSLTYYWRAHAGTLLAAAVGTAVLTGALIVGDSVRHSLVSITQERLGDTLYALVGGDRFFRDDLPQRLASQPVFSGNFSGAHAVLMLPGIAIREANDARALHVQIVGVQQDFWSLGAGNAPAELRSGEIAINAALAQKLGAVAGDQIRIRLSKPGVLPLDAPLGSKTDTAVIVRATVRAILPDRGLGRFGLDANQAAPFNAFLPLPDLQQALKQPGRANLLLIAGTHSGPAEQTAAEAALASAWTLDDAQIHMHNDAALNFTELSTPRVFFDDEYAHAQIEGYSGGARGIITYFVNAIRCNGNATPYSMVTAADAPLTDPDLKDGEIELNAWTAEDLKAKVGDRVEIEFYAAGLLRQLEVRKEAFTLKAIVPIEGLHADRNLMPEFPGIADVDTTHDWDSSIPIDMKKIRDKDEAYWKQYRGTPKAFITLNKGRELWKNRFGTYTALRFRTDNRAAAENQFLAGATPQRLLPVKAMGAGSAADGTDFGGLFLGFSFFLIAAALLLMALVFQFGIESRSAETGLLLAIGFTPGRVRALLLLEGTLLAVLGSAIGVAGAAYYAQALLYGLATRWNAAVGTSALEYHAEPSSLAIGYCSGVLAAAITIFFSVRRQSKRPARELLASGGGSAPELPQGRRRGGKSIAVAAISAAAAVSLAGWAYATGTRSSSEVFFSAGALLLIASLLFIRQLFRPAAHSEGTQDALSAPARWLALGRLGVRGCSRRGGRSAAVAALLACGAFLVIAVGANQQDSGAHASENSSGTGGFEYYAESTLPIFEDLNTKKGRENIGIADALLDGVSVFPFRVHKGDEASCLNLNRANHPRILGVPRTLIERGGFTFAGMLDKKLPKGNPWTMLTSPAQGGAISAICDDQALTYILGKKLGQELTITDEHGAEQRLQFTGTLESSILQGSVLISEENYLKLFPSQSGYNVFLLDDNGKKINPAALAKALSDEGFDLTPGAARLASFSAIENTYLSTFAALGSLGMLLGSLGLGVVVLRNMLERQSELALLRALGFSRRDIGWLVLSEHVWLLFLGLAAGTISALIAIAPALQSANMPVPWASLGGTLLSVFGFGLFAALLATAWMLSRPLLAALRSE